MAAKTCRRIEFRETAIKEMDIVRKVFALAVGLSGLLMTQGLLPPAGVEAASQGSSDLRDLTDLKQLQDEFNRDKGKPRLVLLLSPT